MQRRTTQVTGSKPAHLRKLMIDSIISEGLHAYCLLLTAYCFLLPASFIQSLTKLICKQPHTHHTFNKKFFLQKCMETSTDDDGDSAATLTKATLIFLTILPAICYKPQVQELISSYLPQQTLSVKKQNRQSR